MGNTTVTYTATEKLVNPVDSLVVLDLDLVQFEQQLDQGRSEAQSISGHKQVTSNYVTEVYSCTTNALLGTDVDAIREFLYSVLSGEEFDFTNMDEADRVMTCQLVGNVSRSRPTTGTLKFFTFSFNVREIPA